MKLESKESGGMYNCRIVTFKSQLIIVLTMCLSIQSTVPYSLYLINGCKSECYKKQFYTPKTNSGISSAIDQELHREKKGHLAQHVCGIVRQYEPV